MHLQNTILGVLVDGPSHGYSLKKYLGRSRGLDINDGQLYPALRKLEREGLIQKEVVHQRAHPPKHLYRVTERGREAFLGWLEGSDATAGLESFWKSEFLQKCAFFHHLEAEQIGPLVRAKLEEVERSLGELFALEGELDGQVGPYRRMVVEFGIRYQRMRQEWLEELLERAGERTTAEARRAAGR